jgi:4-carboxymuconolactone decarboxylase
VSKPDETYAAGLDIRRKMFGAAGADEQVAAANDFTRPLQDYVTKTCFGETWTRPHLDHKTRSMITLAILTSLGRQNQVRTHVQGAIANGVSKEEIREVLMHTIIYAGLPAGVDSFRTAGEVFKQLGLE